MHKFFTSAENIIENTAKIIGDDVKHIYKVLRLAEGDKVVLNDCEGNEFLASITDITKSEVNLEIQDELENNNESGLNITLFQAIPKAQKLDFIIQKGTELGINTFRPIITERVDVKVNGEFKKIDRLKRIALEACKQCKRCIIPKVLEPIEIDQLLVELDKCDLIIVPYENAEGYGMKEVSKEVNKENIKNVGIIIGPEGGFEKEEIDMLKNAGAKIITLGKRILRTETAGFVATSLIQYEFGDLGGIE